MKSRIALSEILVDAAPFFLPCLDPPHGAFPHAQNLAAHVLDCKVESKAECQSSRVYRIECCIPT